MRLLLPPSEAKAAGGRGPALATRAVDGPLALARAELGRALDRLVAGDPDRAAQALLLPAGVTAHALAANAAVAQSPTTPALRRYAGVLYEGLAYATLSAAAQRIARRDTLIFSGLFGVVQGGEPVPDYRVPAKATLPGIGVVATYWRPRLADLLPPLLGSGLIVDLRSSDYSAMWRPRPGVADRVVRVRVLSPTPSGGLGVISYPSKLAKGRLAAALVTRVADRARISTIDDVAATWESATGCRSAIVQPGLLELYTG